MVARRQVPDDVGAVGYLVTVMVPRIIPFVAMAYGSHGTVHNQSNSPTFDGVMEIFLTVGLPFFAGGSFSSTPSAADVKLCVMSSSAFVIWIVTGCPTFKLKLALLVIACTLPSTFPIDIVSLTIRGWVRGIFVWRIAVRCAP